MEKKLLHITNGDVMTDKIAKLDIPGDVIVWREMLSEGPTMVDIGADEFFEMRANFLLEHYNISKERYNEDFVKEIEKLSTINNYDEIVLWFEFDLFCHLNMLAAISFLVQNKKKTPVYLVCSSRLPGEEKLQNLSNLDLKQLKKHFECRISLTDNDLQLAHTVWELYCSSKPKRLSAELQKTSNFEYLSSCIKAHLERFPRAQVGLNTMEINVLKLIEKHKIISEHHLLGYALEYQGYYGYLEPQMQKTITKLRPFFKIENDQIVLTQKGKDAIKSSHNFYQELKNEEFYGGAKKYDFLYDPVSHKLLKL